jgi:hypothetical protein
MHDRGAYDLAGDVECDVAAGTAQQTAVVTCDGVPHTFAPQEFRAAVAKADVELLRFEIDACGTVEDAGATRWFIAGPNRFPLAGSHWTA